MQPTYTKSGVCYPRRTTLTLAAALLLSAGGALTTHAHGQRAPVRETASNAPASAPSPKMRTRIMTSLTGYEVADYLKRSDVLFVPVGPTELNGGSPTDVEYVIPLAYALKLAEKGDGLVLPYLAYFYPGSTTISPGTVQITPEEGIQYLKALTRSLIRQGFRRIVFLTSHGPSMDTMRPLVREIFDEYHVPVVWMDCGVIGLGDHQRPDYGAAAARPASAPTAPARSAFDPNERELITFGSYMAVGRLDDIPVGFSVPEHQFEADKALSNLSRHLNPAMSDVGRFYADPSEHGGLPKAITAEQRTEMGRKGLAIIDSQVAGYDITGMLDALRGHDAFTRTLEKQYGPLLPPGPPPGPPQK